MPVESEQKEGVCGQRSFDSGRKRRQDLMQTILAHLNLTHIYLTLKTLTQMSLKQKLTQFDPSLGLIQPTVA